MKHYTSYISVELAEKLKTKGMPMMPCFNITQTGSFSDDGGIRFYYIPVYAEVLDWLMERGKVIAIEVEMDERNDIWEAYICWMADNLVPSCKHLENYHSWHSAADAAIAKALELIK